MRKHLDNLFSALMLAAAIAVVLAGGWCLRRSIAQAGAERTQAPVAPVHLELPEPEPVATPLPTPTPAPDKPAYDPAIPLSAEPQAALYDACAEHDVPVALALGVIQVESCFQEDAVSECGAYGLMQLNPKYFPDGLSPADNLRAGIARLGELLERYGDPGAALTAYCVGYDAGGRTYAGAVLDAAEGWSR